MICDFLPPIKLVSFEWVIDVSEARFQLSHLQAHYFNEIIIFSSFINGLHMTMRLFVFRSLLRNAMRHMEESQTVS